MWIWHGVLYRDIIKGVLTWNSIDDKVYPTMMRVQLSNKAYESNYLLWPMVALLFMVRLRIFYFGSLPNFQHNISFFHFFDTLIFKRSSELRVESRCFLSVGYVQFEIAWLLTTT